jgi:hypothetical protein
MFASKTYRDPETIVYIRGSMTFFSLFSAEMGLTLDSSGSFSLCCLGCYFSGFFMGGIRTGSADAFAILCTSKAALINWIFVRPSVSSVFTCYQI